MLSAPELASPPGAILTVKWTAPGIPPTPPLALHASLAGSAASYPPRRRAYSEMIGQYDSAMLARFEE